MSVATTMLRKAILGLFPTRLSPPTRHVQPRGFSCCCHWLQNQNQRVCQVPQVSTNSTQPVGCHLLLTRVSLQPVTLRCRSEPSSSSLTRQARTCLQHQDSQVLLLRGFITSRPRHAIPPLLALLFVKPITKLTVIFSGRAFRNWWRALPDSKRRYFYESLRKNAYKILGTSLVISGICWGYYYTHLQETPITNRKRFIAFTDGQLQKIAATEYEKISQLHAENSVPNTHPLYMTIAGIIIKITEGNNDIPQIRDRTWTIHIVDKDIKNAFVLPNGEIFVFTGILEAVANEEQLGTVLSHEIAHVVLNHAAEQVSFFEFIDILMIVVLAAIWAFLPSDGLAIVATWFKNKVVQLLLEMPYSRSLESEADRVGLVLAAKSCFDVRESKAFWELMALQSELQGDEVNIEWLSTHPTNQNRADTLENLIPEALELRRLCKCPPLPPGDPSEAVRKQRKILAEEYERRKKHPKVISGLRINTSQ